MSGETLSQTAYRRIKQDILEGRIAPDTILSERDLAESLGISRTPLRSALSRLENESVIGRMGNGALIVRPVTIEQLLEIVQLRQILERAAAARAATMVPSHGLSPKLQELRTKMLEYADSRAVEFNDFWQSDDAFHLAVARAAGLNILPAILAEQRAIARRCTITRTHDRFADQAREHVAVIDAIAKGNEAAAYDAMSLHFEHARARFLAWFSHS